MRKHTDAHTTVVDPTGREELMPSKAVTLPAKAFGRGFASDAVIEKVKEGLPDVTLASSTCPRFETSPLVATFT